MKIEINKEDIEDGRQIVIKRKHFSEGNDEISITNNPQILERSKEEFLDYIKDEYEKWIIAVDEDEKKISWAVEQLKLLFGDLEKKWK